MKNEKNVAPVSVAPVAPVAPVALDTKSGRPLAIANANRSLGTILRAIGILVNFEPYKNVEIDGSIYHSRFTFTGKNPTGNFTAVLAALADIGFDIGKRVQLTADHSLSKYNPKIPVFAAKLAGKTGSPVAEFVIVVYGSDNPETGLIPIFNVISHPVAASVAPKQNDKSLRSAVSAKTDLSIFA